MVTSLAVANQAVRELTAITASEGVTATQKGTPLYRRDRFEWRGYYEAKMLFESDGLTSTTYIRDSSMTTALYHPPAFAPSLQPISFSPSENEVLIASDAQMAFFGKREGLQVARLVNTPAKRPLSYFIAMGIRFAFKHRLSLPYNPDGNTVTKSNSSRYNHGLEHCIRKVFYVEPLIDYLARFSEVVATE